MFLLSSEPKRPQTLPKTKAFENGFISEPLKQNQIKRRRNALPFLSAFSVALVWTLSENVSRRVRFHAKRISVESRKQTKNASVGENILLRPR